MNGISVITCSRSAKAPSSFLNNITETIGIEHEVIAIDNSENNYSIFEAYNLGVAQSNYDILCFVHDDIKVHTNNWGKILRGLFSSDPSIGLIGVTGTRVKTKMPSTWWSCPEDEKVLHIMQHLEKGKVENWHTGFEKHSLVDVAVIDGVFMVAKKDDSIKFEESFKGFHNYDLHLSFETIKKGKKVVATNKILIEHFSFGTLNKSWYASTIQIHKMYGDILPLKVNSNMEEKAIMRLETENGIWMAYKLLELNLKKEALAIWSKIFLLKPISKFHLKFLKAFLS
ncbi:glycosyltransferase [Hyunsoonleella rubra]|uniref:Glycosyltransferase n=1 Tax=Hyunsoonleella rubra TaxID=1737062 RepID=A0ABW5TEU1_9FLAO